MCFVDYGAHCKVLHYARFSGVKQLICIPNLKNDAKELKVRELVIFSMFNVIYVHLFINTYV